MQELRPNEQKRRYQPARPGHRNPWNLIALNGTKLHITIWVAILLAGLVRVHAQPPQKDVASPEATASHCYYVGSIRISGNEKTRASIIRRELPFSTGDTLCGASLDQAAQTAEQTLINTRLFRSVRVTPYCNSLGHEVEFVIQVEERWYWFIFPHFELVDRSFNEWWVNQERDFSRTEYGVKGYYENFRGRNEEITIKAITGYINRIELGYHIPFFSWNQHLGARFEFRHHNRREVLLRTRENQQEFFELGDVLQRENKAFVTLQYRPRLFAFHDLRLGFNQTWVGDTIVHLNDRYFDNENNLQRFFELRYQFQWNRLNVQAYPTQGGFLEMSYRRMGLGLYDDLDLNRIKLTAKKFYPLNEKWHVAAMGQYKWDYPAQQPFYNLSSLGYQESYVRGYDLYVIDGQQFGLFKTALRRELFKEELQLDFIPIQQFRTIPLKILGKTYLDGGYVVDDYYQEFGDLSNKLLIGGGLGVDIVTFYDVVYRVEYSWNRQGESGFFVYFSLGI